MNKNREPRGPGKAWWSAKIKRYPFQAYLSPANDIKRLIDDKVETHTPFVSIRCMDEGRLYAFSTAEARDRIADLYGMENVT